MQCVCVCAVCVCCVCVVCVCGANMGLVSHSTPTITNCELLTVSIGARCETTLG